MLSAKVARIRQEAVDVKSFELVCGCGESLPPFTPGSHIDVHIAAGLVRQYSLCNGPGEARHYRIAVKKEPASRGGSAAMHERLREGDVVAIGTPRNNFPLHNDAPSSILVAGGIGITPLLAMALHLAHSARRFTLHYFVRSPAHAALREQLCTPALEGKVRFHYALEPRDVNKTLEAMLAERSDGAQLYLCGPRPFMDCVQAAAATSWPREAVNLEYFSADPGALARPKDTFVVRLARSGGEYVIPADKSIATALAENGVTIVTGCEQGACGVCVTRVLEGTPDHRDFILSAAEQAAGDRIACCVSRSLTPVLVLDI